MRKSAATRRQQSARKATLDSFISRKPPPASLDSGTPIDGLPQRPASGEPGPDRRRHFILIVDDDAAVRRMLTHSLSERGYAVKSASGADEALRLCRERRDPIEILLLDINLDGPGGYLLAGLLLRIHPEMQVLYISGHSREYLRTVSPAFEVHQFVEKPFVVQSLLGRVRQALLHFDGTGGPR